jgi:hypothetical protein
MPLLFLPYCRNVRDYYIITVLNQLIVCGVLTSQSLLLSKESRQLMHVLLSTLSLKQAKWDRHNLWDFLCMTSERWSVCSGHAGFSAFCFEISKWDRCTGRAVWPLKQNSPSFDFRQWRPLCSPELWSPCSFQTSAYRGKAAGGSCWLFFRVLEFLASVIIRPAVASNDHAPMRAGDRPRYCCLAGMKCMSEQWGKRGSSNSCTTAKTWRWQFYVITVVMMAYRTSIPLHFSFCGLFSDSLCICDYTASIGGMIHMS